MRTVPLCSKKHMRTVPLCSNVRLLDSIDHVFIFAKCISHKLFYRVINEVRKRDIPVNYVSKVNEDLAVKEIKRALSKREVS